MLTACALEAYAPNGLVSICLTHCLGRGVRRAYLGRTPLDSNNSVHFF